MPLTIVKPDDSAIERAVEILHAGGVVAMPTETVYGLAADTFNEKAIDRVYEMKGRPADNPLIAHVQDVDGARRVTAEFDDRCCALAEVFWPGPLTLVVPKAADVPDGATAGLKMIAVRCPDHPVAQQLLAAFGSSLSAPSANRSGHVSPTTAQHVADDFAHVDELFVLDGGPCELGIESTVVEVGETAVRVLRPGSIAVEQLRTVAGDVVAPVVDQQTASPGTTAAHYAPHTPARLVSADELRSLMRELGDAVVVIATSAPSDWHSDRFIGMPNEPAAYAAKLYSALREADARGVERILIEQPPMRDPHWRAVVDRLRRATA